MITKNGNEDFEPVVNELIRSYDFGDGRFVDVLNVIAIRIGSDGHNLLTKDGVSHAIPHGWIHLAWQKEEGAPRFGS